MDDSFIDGDDQQRKGLAEIAKGDTSKLILIKNSVYESLYQLFFHTSSKESDFKSLKLKFCLMTAFETVQILASLEICNYIAQWSTYGLFWETLLFLRLDYLAFRFGGYRTMFYALQVALTTAFLLFTCLVLLLYYQRKPKNFLVLLVRVFFVFFANLVYIPAQVMLSMQIFGDYIQAYPYGLTAEDLLTGWYLKALSCLNLLILNLIKYFHIIGTAETKHTFHKLNFSSRCSSDIEINHFFFRFVLIAFYAVNGAFLPTYFLLLCLGEIMVLYRYTQEFPYYNALANKTKMASCLCVSAFALALLVGELLDDAGVAFLLTVLVVPVLLAIIALKYHLKFPKNKRALRRIVENPQQISSLIEFERILRPFLMGESEDLKVMILNAFTAFYLASYRNRNSELVIWQCNYCLTSLDDIRLARIKLSIFLNSMITVETDYQNYLCYRHMDCDDRNYYEDVDFIDFKFKLELTKNLDKSFCQRFYWILEELSEENPRVDKLDDLLMNIHEKKKKINNYYDDLANKYDRSTEVIEMYTSFLTNILKNNKKAVFLKERRIVQQVPRVGLDLFDEKNGILIVSCECSTTGIITYANPMASEILQEPVQSLTGKDISKLTPSPINSYHGKFMQNFLLKCTDSKLHFPTSMIMCTEIGYLIEVYFQARCLTMGAYPFFLVMIKRKEKNREIIMVDENWSITNHSQHVPKVLKINAKILKWLSLKTFIPKISELENMAEKEVFIPSIQAFLVFHTKRIKNTPLKVCYLYQEEMHKCMSDSGSEKNEHSNFICTHINKKKRKLEFYNQPKNNSTNTANSKHKSRIDLNIPINASNQGEEALAKEKEKEMNEIIDNSKKQLKIINWILGLFLFFIIFINIGNVLYVSYGFDNNPIFEVIFELSYAKHSMINIVNMARTLQLYKDHQVYSELLEGIPDRFTQEITLLKEFRAIEKHANDLFPRCTELRTTYLKEKKYWYKGELTSGNILSIVDVFVLYAYNYFEGDASHESYNFLVKNGVGFPYEHIFTLEKLIQYCADDAIDYYNSIILGFFVGESIVIVILLTLAAHYLLLMRALSLEQWKKLLEALTTTCFNLQSFLINRLEVIHEMKGMLFKSINSKWGSIVIRYTRYMWRISLMVVVSFGYLAFLNLYLNNNLSSSIKYRRNFTYEMTQAGALIDELNWWTREAQLMNSEMNLCSTLTDSCPFPPASEKLLKTQTNLMKFLKEILARKDMTILDEELNFLYGNFTFNDIVFYDGLYGSIKLMMIDSLYYSGQSQLVPASFLSDFDTIHELKNILIREIIDNTDEIITEDRQNFYLISSLFCLSVVVIFLVFNKKFLDREYMVIKSKAAFYKIIKL